MVLFFESGQFLAQVIAQIRHAAAFRAVIACGQGLERLGGGPGEEGVEHIILHAASEFNHRQRHVLKRLGAVPHALADETVWVLNIVRAMDEQA